MSTFDSRYGLVVEVEADTERLVMRSSPDPDALFQAEVSQQLAKLGIGPDIREVIATKSGVWTVAARILPGYTLKNRPVPVEQLAAALRPLRDQPASAHLPTLTAWLSSRLTATEDVDMPSGRTTAPEAERQHAAALLSELAEQPPQTLCHGDTSSKNILMGPAGKLYLIDPRGLSGDIAYDVAVAAWKTTSDDPLQDRAAELARLVGVDTERVQAWLVVAEAARV
ncbi:aminoglycoside phosphotransferase family protein [Spirillospora sp. NPDC029432]|uniref:aminoglycoside phosphotransferase family protein n=1 Tax=Spirillospora sp. NPDC029432 TaxID=3154599 RepID=UPI003454F177